MSRYSIAILKNGKPWHSFEVKCTAGVDPKDGLGWTARRADGWFEEDLQGCLENWWQGGRYQPEFDEPIPTPVSDKLGELLLQGWSYPEAFAEAMKLNT